MYHLYINHVSKICYVVWERWGKQRTCDTEHRWWPKSWILQLWGISRNLLHCTSAQDSRIDKQTRPMPTQWHGLQSFLCWSANYVLALLHAVCLHIGKMLAQCLFYCVLFVAISSFSTTCASSYLTGEHTTDCSEYWNLKKMHEPSQNTSSCWRLSQLANEPQMTETVKVQFVHAVTQLVRCLVQFG